MNRGGITFISAFTAATRIEGFANSFGDSCSAATAVITSQNMGAAKTDRVKKIWFDSLIICMLLGLTCAFLLFFFSGGLVRLMLKQTNGAAYQNAVSYLKTVACFYFFCFTGDSYTGYLNGRSWVLVPFAGAVCHITLRVILSWLLFSRLQLSAIAVSTGCGWILANILWSVYLLRKHNQGTLWKL